MGIRVFILVCIILISCDLERTHDEVDKAYSNDVGDILFNNLTDNKNFLICDSTKISTSRRGLAYLGASGSVKNACIQKFDFNPSFESFSGFITIRFIVNCQYETDRFRVQTMDFDFSAKNCPDALKKHLIQIVRELDQWQTSASRYEGLDFAKYLNFKIEHGRITNVLQ